MRCGNSRSTMDYPLIASETTKEFSCACLDAFERASSHNGYNRSGAFCTVKRNQVSNRQVFATSMAAWVTPENILSTLHFLICFIDRPCWIEKLGIAMIKTNTDPPPSGLFFDYIYYVDEIQNQSFMIEAITSNNENLWPFKMTGIHDWHAKSGRKAASCLRDWNENIFDRYDPRKDDSSNSVQTGEPVSQTGSLPVASPASLETGGSGSENAWLQPIQPNPVVLNVTRPSLPVSPLSQLGKRSRRIPTPDNSESSSTETKSKKLRGSTGATSLSPEGAQASCVPNDVRSPSRKPEELPEMTLSCIPSSLKAISKAESAEDNFPRMKTGDPSSLQLASQVDHLKRYIGPAMLADATMATMNREYSNRDININLELVNPELRSSSPSSIARNILKDTIVKPEEPIAPPLLSNPARQFDDHVSANETDGNGIRSSSFVSKVSSLVSNNHMGSLCSSSQLVYPRSHEDRSDLSAIASENTILAAASISTNTTPTEDYSPSTSYSSAIVMSFQASATPQVSRFFHAQLEDGTRTDYALKSRFDNDPDNVQWSPIAREEALVSKIKQLELELESKSLALQQKSSECEAKSLEVASLKRKLQETADDRDLVKHKRDVAIAERDGALQETGRVEQQLREYREYFRLHSKLSSCT
ncbi:hypothetical protein J3R30DRAFT_637210 [Lentinula aciculospora]|uniref:Uncharacterized protein n=1 Tax=Lentinula aciculospora TaxID=153920 RepID=A0A9W9A6C7_9AGAR|nr:hypothetical protein J3R30DRAFT_637210 [Lentinula aciculospora]